MESFYSILQYVNDPLSNTKVALGLLAVSNDQVHFQLSDQKLEIAKKLNNKNYKLLDFSLKQFQEFIEKDLKDESHFLIQSKKTINKNYINKLANYNNGILQFSKPEVINSEISSSDFVNYFNRLIVEEP